MVYVDVLLAVNFAIDFLILKAAALFSGARANTLRLIMGAAVGAASSLIIFFPPEGRLLPFLYRGAASFAICAAAFCPCRPRTLFKAVFIAFLLAFVISGAVLLWQLTAQPQGVIGYGGAVYFDIGVPALILCSTAGYICACLLSGIMSRAFPEGQFCEVTVVNNGAVVRFTALIDTGSSLVEPFSSRPVIVCELAALGAAAPMGIASFCAGGPPEGGIRLVPYKTLDSNGLLPAFLPERLLLKRGDGGMVGAAGCYVAAIDKALGEGYRAICNPRAFLYDEKAGDAFYEETT